MQLGQFISFVPIWIVDNKWQRLSTLKLFELSERTKFYEQL